MTGPFWKVQNFSLICRCLRWPPVKNDAFYDVAGFENAQKRYRFGTARRDHCAVPAWRSPDAQSHHGPEPRCLPNTTRNKGENDKGVINPLMGGKSKTIVFFFPLAQLN